MIGLLFLAFSTKMAFCAFLEELETTKKRQGQLTGTLKKRQLEELDGKTEAKRQRLKDLSLLEQREKDRRLWQVITDKNLNFLNLWFMRRCYIFFIFCRITHSI